MIDAAEAVFWCHDDTHQILIRPHSWGCPEEHSHIKPRNGWGDPIGAAYSEWQGYSTEDRVTLMLETIIDLAMQGYPIKELVTAFAEVREFRALGGKSYPMCRALTSALVGRCLEANTISFDELLVAYAPKEAAE
jgi:hypothetical protein